MTAPVVGDRHKPIGVLTVNDALQALLKEVEHEEELLREYVMCVGYRRGLFSSPDWYKRIDRQSQQVDRFCSKLIDDR